MPSGTTTKTGIFGGFVAEIIGISKSWLPGRGPYAAIIMPRLRGAAWQPAQVGIDETVQATAPVRGYSLVGPWSTITTLTFCPRNCAL
jgi:hypothetical protein